MTNEILNLKVSDIYPNKNQPRADFDDEKMKELSNSIKSTGLINPIQVKQLTNGKYEIISGERRWRAHQLAGIKTISAIVKPSDALRNEIESLVENSHRENLTLNEQGKFYQSLKDKYKISALQIAKMCGMSESHIVSAMNFVKVPDDIKNIARDGSIAENDVTEITEKVSDKQQVKKILKLAIKEGWGRKNIRETSWLVKNAPKDVSSALLDEHISPSQATAISKFTDIKHRKQAISEHKTINKTAAKVEKNIAKPKQMLKARNIVATFRANAVEGQKMVDRVSKSLVPLIQYSSALDDENKKKLEHYLKLWEATISNALEISKQVDDKLR